MRKLGLTLIPICIGSVLLLLSWYLSYPVSIDSPYDFAYNHFSYLYWLGLALLFVSFFIVAMETKNDNLRWAMTIGTILLMFSQAYFYYTIPDSDANLFRGLTEYYLSTSNLSTSIASHYYYQWPLFFIFGKIVVSITGLDLRYVEFVMYGALGLVAISFIYLLISKVVKNASPAVIAFFMILIYFSDFQFWVPYFLAFSLILLLLYLDRISERSREIIVATVIVFIAITYTHILVPVFFVVYCLVMYSITKKEKYLGLFGLTLTIYTLVLVSNPQLTVYLKQLGIINFGQGLLYRIAATTAGSVAPQPPVGVVAQFFSRAVVITVTLVTSIGFIILLRMKKLTRTDYAMLITGAIFATAILIAPSSYYELSNRAFFLICIPVSLGASYLCESRLRRFFKPVFLILLVLFTFALIHQAFGNEIFFQTKAEYQCSNFLIDNINWNAPISILSTFRVEQYLAAKSPTGVVTFVTDSSADFPKNITKCNYIVYTIGLSESFLAFNYSVPESVGEFEVNHFNLIYDSGNFSCIFSK